MADIICPMCGFVLDDYNNLIEHAYVEHNITEEDLSYDPNCGFILKKDKKIPTYRIFKCPETKCDYINESRKMIWTHVERRHHNSDNDYVIDDIKRETWAEQEMRMKAEKEEAERRMKEEEKKREVKEKEQKRIEDNEEQRIALYSQLSKKLIGQFKRIWYSGDVIDRNILSLEIEQIRLLLKDLRLYGKDWKHLIHAQKEYEIIEDSVNDYMKYVKGNQESE